MQRYNVGRVVSSPLRRCLDTARPTAGAAGVPIEREPLLLEIAHGRWEGRLREDLEREDPERYRRWRHEPENVEFEEGESMRDVLERWTLFAARFVPLEDTLVVTHDAMIRVALVERLGRPLAAFWQGKVLNGAYAWFAIEDGRWTLRSECVSDHLAGIIADPSAQAL